MRCWFLFLLFVAACNGGVAAPALCVDGARATGIQVHPAAPLDVVVVFDAASFDEEGERARVADETARVIRGFATGEGGRPGADVRVGVVSACGADASLHHCEGAPASLRFGRGEGQPWDVLRCALDAPPERCVPRPVESAERWLSDATFRRPDAHLVALLVGRRDACDGDPGCVVPSPVALAPALTLVIVNDVGGADHPYVSLDSTDAGGCGVGRPVRLIEAAEGLQDHGATAAAQPVCAPRFDHVASTLHVTAARRFPPIGHGYAERPEGCRAFLELDEEDDDDLCEALPGARLRGWAHGRLCELQELLPTGEERRRGWLPEGTGFFFDDYTGESAIDGVSRFWASRSVPPRTMFVACEGGAHHGGVRVCGGHDDCGPPGGVGGLCDPVTGHCRPRCETDDDCFRSVCVSRQGHDATPSAPLCATLCEPVW